VTTNELGLGQRDRRHRLVVRGTAAADLAGKIGIRYRYRSHKRSKLGAITKTASVHQGAFVAHLKLSHAAKRARKGTLTASYPGDGTHAPAKLNQRVKLTGRENRGGGGARATGRPEES
jgi:hypothetical protein